MRGKFYKRTDISAVKRLFLGAGMAMAALLLFSAIFSGISMLTDDAAAKIPLFAILTLVVSAAVGGAVSTRTVSDGRLSLALLSALAEEGKCVLAVMHDLEGGIAIAHRALLLDGGALTFAGTKEELLATDRLETAFGVRRYTAEGRVFFA
jgi:hypothetical protein